MILTTPTAVSQVVATFDTVHVSYSAKSSWWSENTVYITARGRQGGERVQALVLPTDLDTLRETTQALHRAVLSLPGDRDHRGQRYLRMLVSRRRRNARRAPCSSSRTPVGRCHARPIIVNELDGEAYVHPLVGELSDSDERVLEERTHRPCTLGEHTVAPHQGQNHDEVPKPHGL